MTNKPKDKNTSFPLACKKHVFIALGWVFFGLGLIGAFLPVMPTVLFMILALWAFANGSENLHNWLYNHPRFGPSLQRWDKHRVIPMHAKIAAIGGMVLSLIYVIAFSDAPPVGKFAATAFITFGAVYVITKPSREPASETEN